MRKILTSFAFIAASLTFAQVGVNNEDPKATLHIDAKNNETSGILVPRVTREAARDMPDPALGESIVESTLIYVTEVETGDQTGKAIYIDSPGFYYFSDGAWTKIVKAQKKMRFEQVASETYVWKDPVDGWADYYEFTSGNYLRLPNPVDNRGRTLYIKRRGGGTMLFKGDDGVGTPYGLAGISALSAIEVYSNGEKWYVISGRN